MPFCHQHYFLLKLALKGSDSAYCLCMARWTCTVPVVEFHCHIIIARDSRSFILIILCMEFCIAHFCEFSFVVVWSKYPRKSQKLDPTKLFPLYSNCISFPAYTKEHHRFYAGIHVATDYSDR